MPTDFNGTIFISRGSIILTAFFGPRYCCLWRGWIGETPFSGQPKHRNYLQAFCLTNLRRNSSDNHVVSDSFALFRRTFDKSHQNSVPKSTLLRHLSAILCFFLYDIFVKTLTWYCLLVD